MSFEAAWETTIDALREAGADLVTVAALLGRESVATTAIYTQPGEADLMKAVEKLK